MSLAKGLSILFIFSKNQLLVLLLFAIVFFVSISFISALIFMISFLLLTLTIPHITYMRHREVKELALVHTASKRQS